MTCLKNIFGCTKAKQLKVRVRWIPSHLQDKMSADEDFQLPKNVSSNDVAGNSWADELAGTSAQSFDLPLNITSPHIYHKNLVKRIRRRLMIILCSLPNRPKHIPKASIPKEPLEEMYTISKHIIYNTGDGRKIGCARCKQIRDSKGHFTHVYV